MMETPRLKNDCFALPEGVDWTPVDQALERLRTRLRCVVPTEKLKLGDADARILAAPVQALRANPPTANSAVDGYGFAHASLHAGANSLALSEHRAAAGRPYRGHVPEGQAIRILTGAQIPTGVDTVILQEDINLQNGRIVFQGELRKGANARRAGEDVNAGQTLFEAGHIMRPQDIALVAATGTAELSVFKRLRVGVLSTGDEIHPAGAKISNDKIYDANRPMLMSVLERWGMEAIDLGHVNDDRDGLRSCLNSACQTVDAILTSGGASAGDEDHLSAILTDEGAMNTWRIAVKPGRPLALGQWNSVPVFGLPGNPVAALVCTLIFARPALYRMAGANWRLPQGYQVPAAFSKNKKAGRREYLRAVLNTHGQAEVFHSEGSGRISGLGWADGLVELPDHEENYQPGSVVTYFPYEAFGL